MRILIVTDAWAPQINGVVRTLTRTRQELEGLGHEIRVISPDSVETKLAMVVKCGVVSAESAMNTTCSRHSAAICRLWITPLEYANKTIFNKSAGSYAGAPVASFWYRSSNTDKSILLSMR